MMSIIGGRPASARVGYVMTNSLADMYYTRGNVSGARHAIAKCLCERNTVMTLCYKTYQS